MAASALLAIRNQLRLGAVDRAWRMFREAGLEAVGDDPAVLILRGRLLKERAAAAPGLERGRLYGDAAEAYAQAAELGAGSYPLINAASLALLVGDGEVAHARAAAVIAALEADPTEPESGYWGAATRAEALLVQGQVAAARAALAQAMSLAPRAWEEHVPTLRQFGLILAALGEDAGWLNSLRPPRCLHFAGHMALGGAEARIRDQVRALLAAAPASFGYGALAPGADMVIAEALLAGGASLQVVLPAEPQAFRAATVAPAGGEWPARFDALIAAAESVRVVDGAEPDHPLAIRLAAEVAMGCAVAQAAAMQTVAAQMVVVDPAADEPGSSGWTLARWAASGRPQQVVEAPRATPPAAAAPASPAQLVALVLAEFDPRGDEDLVEVLVPEVARALLAAPAPLSPPHWSGRRLEAVYGGPGEAAAAMLGLAEAAPHARIAAHYGLARTAPDPFADASSPLRLGRAAALPVDILGTLNEPGIRISADFAAALQASRRPVAARTAFVEDLTSPAGAIGLYALGA